MAELVGYLGTMNSMKSAMALMRAHKYTQDGETYIAFKSANDTREESNTIQSRALGEGIPCIMVSDSEYNLIYDTAVRHKPDHIIVDEIQFMTSRHINELTLVAKILDIPVECYGLKVDFRSRLFEGSKRLIELADRIEWVENKCSTKGCESQATMNLRTEDGIPTLSGSTIQVGKEESYTALCPACYLLEISKCDNEIMDKLMGE